MADQSTLTDFSLGSSVSPLFVIPDVCKLEERVEPSLPVTDHSLNPVVLLERLDTQRQHTLQMAEVKTEGDMSEDNNKSSANEVPASRNCDRDGDAGQTSPAEGATGSLPSQSNPACFVTEICVASAMEAEVLSQEETVNVESNETDEEDPSLFLECNSEPEFDIELAEFREVNATSDKNKARPGKPANQAGSSLAKTKNHDSVYKPPYKVSHYCTFCGMLQSAIGLHLVSCHRDQMKVSQLLQQQLRSKERRDEVERLTAEGDYKHNQQNMGPSNRGWVRCKFCRKLVQKNAAYQHHLGCKATAVRKMNKTDRNLRKTTYNESQKSSCSHAQCTSKYLRCERCRCFVLRSAMWLHYRRCFWTCHKAKIGRLGSDIRLSSHTATKRVGPCNQFTSHDNLLKNRNSESNVDDVLNLITDRDDDESLRSVMTEDTLIRQYASVQMRSFRGQDCESFDNIYNLCKELRTLARLVIECRRRKPSADLYTLIHPDHFNLVITTSRRQPATVVNILGRVVNAKLIDALQHDDNIAARHAWNFRELFVLWRESLAEDDAVWQTNNNNNNKVQEEGLSATDNRHQTLSETFQQPDKIECDTDTQSELEEICSQHDNACLPEANAFIDNPLQHVFPNSSFLTLALDQVGSILPDNCIYLPKTTPETFASTAAQGDCIDRREMSDITDGTHCLLGSSANDHECTVTSDDVHSVDLESSSLHISSSRAINICRSSRENSYCYVCGQPQYQLQYHLKSVHAKEKEVMQLASLATFRATFTARIQRMAQLRNYGNHLHNQKVLKAGRGTLMVLYNPNTDAKSEDYSPCNDCWSYLTREQLLRHQCKVSVQKRGRPNHITAVSSHGISVGKFAKPGRIVKKAHDIQVITHRSVYGHTKARCYFCGSWFSWVQRHWYAKHQNHPEVKKVLSLGKTDKKTQLEYAARLQRLAAHEHNVQVLKQGHGQLFVSRYSKQYTPADYLPCEYCWSYLARDCLWRHRPYCKSMPEWEQKTSVHYATFLLPTPKIFHDQVSNVLDGMQDDNLKFVVESDQLIHEYVAKLLSTGIADKSVKRKTCLIARFLLEIQKLNGLCSATLSECITPENFKRCSLAAEMLGGFDPETLSYQNLAFTLMTKTILRQVSKLLKRDAVDRRDEDAVKELDRFNELCVTEWKSPGTSPEQEMDLEVEAVSDR